MTKSRFALLVLAAAGLAPGCGPYMRQETVGVLAYQAAEPCGQGPYEIVVPATGSRWGEGVEVYAYGPGAIEGTVELSAGDDAATTGSVGAWQTGEYVRTTRDGVEYALTTPGAAVDRARCLATTGDAGPGAGGEVPLGEGVPGGTPVAADRATDGGDVTLTAPSLELHPVPWGRLPELSAQDLAGAGWGRMSMGGHVWVSPDAEVDATPRLSAGAPIRIRFWSTLPNPLEGVTFVVHHLALRPSVSDEEWVAHLEEQRREAEREAIVRAREAAERQAQAQREHDAREARCQAHHEDEGCWGRGGYDVYVARLRREEEERRARGPAPAWQPPAPSAPAAPAEPDGPPPAPQAEARPPRPSAHATWIPGYWRWLAARWVWLGGAWEVPEEDLRVEATVVAPSAPPAPQAEAPPPPPAPGVAWVPGYWQWDGARFVWVSGRYALPTANAEWQAPSWRPRSGGVVFVPGRWAVRVR